MSKTKSSGVTINLPTGVFLAFLVLKLTGTIDWSWWWITSPLWIPVVTLALIAIALIIVTSVAALVVYWFDT
jgi:hypothetical protein